MVRQFIIWSALHHKVHLNTAMFIITSAQAWLMLHKVLFSLTNSPEPKNIQ